MSCRPPIPPRLGWSLALWVGWLCALPSLPAAGQEPDAFYVGLMDDGIHAYQRADYVTAVEDLRIACFGLLETPELLARGLAHLSLAQAELDNREEFARSYRRLVELEERFEAYTRSEISASARRALAAAVERLMSEDEAAASPLLREPAPDSDSGRPRAAQPET